MTRESFLKTCITGMGISGMSATFAEGGSIATAPLTGTSALSITAVPEENPEWLEEWQNRPLIPIQQPVDEVEQRLLGAVRQGDAVTVRYAGGSVPGGTRTIEPTLLFFRPEPAQVETFYQMEAGDASNSQLAEYLRYHASPYLMAWCQERRAQRCFKLARLSLG
ncbi:MAG: hypothetical protein AAF236_08910 [Verrucomicrobiota bacterium]